MDSLLVNKELNDIIRSNVPQGVKVVPFLMDLLSVSRESAYRRLRNEIPYTLQEAVLLAFKLDFSIDELFNNINNKRKSYFNLGCAESESPTENYIEMMKNIIETLNNASDNQFTKAFYVGNKMPDSIVLGSQLLSKLCFIKWVHQTHNLAIGSKFSEVIIPPAVTLVHKEYIELGRKLDHYTAVLDTDIFQSLIDTIKFYYRRSFISDSEILEMKDEMLRLLDTLEEISRTGKNKFGKEHIMYLSYLDIESNIILFEFDERMSVYLLSSGKYPIVTNNEKVCSEQKLWIDSLLKFSVLITRSNEIVQAEYFTEQRKLIENQLMQLFNNDTHNVLS